MYKILLADNEYKTLKWRSQIIKNLGYKCVTAHNGKEAIDLINDEQPHVVLTDIKMPHKNGFDILKAAKNWDPNIPVILYTKFGSVDSAVKAMKLGAQDYIQKFVSAEIIKKVLNEAIKCQKTNLENKLPSVKKIKLNNMIAKSKVMQEIAKRVYKAAKSGANVFIYGESGTGKELIAKNIHAFSNRSNQPFIPLDCVALPKTLIESEIFGYEKGAFTGAVNAKPGYLELADGGILFLDEITELDINLQAKFLRVFQEHQFRRVGGTKIIDVNVRLISASNIIPAKAIQENKIRQDLYYRLNVVPITLPPLRDRKEDIPHLIQHFIELFNPSNSIKINGISNDALKYLIKYNWPGNVRELQNVVEQAMSLSENDTICLEDLPANIRDNDISFEEESNLGINYKDIKEKYLNQIYNKYINGLLKLNNGNISKVARKAGVSRLTVYRILNNNFKKNLYY